MPRFPRAGALLLSATLLACSPALNWRLVRSDAHPLLALLPCKPDTGAREVSMAGTPLRLDMQGCDAAGATFAISHVRLADATQAGEILAGWKTAVLHTLHASSAQEQPFAMPGAWPLPQALRVAAVGQRGDGQAVRAQAVWFARLSPAGVDLFHAVVYADRADKADLAAADTFFAGLKFE